MAAHNPWICGQPGQFGVRHHLGNQVGGYGQAREQITAEPDRR